jgi:hypothetical protein
LVLGGLLEDRQFLLIHAYLLLTHEAQVDFESAALLNLAVQVALVLRNALLMCLQVYRVEQFLLERLLPAVFSVTSYLDTKLLLGVLSPGKHCL